MPTCLREIFPARRQLVLAGGEDEKLVEKIQKRLPCLFQLAEVESSRTGEDCKIWIMKRRLEKNAVRIVMRS